MRLAIIQNGDTPQIESTAMQLAAAGYETRYCGRSLREELVKIGCDTVLSVEHMYALGYDLVDPRIQPATVKDMDRCDLFCEIKVRNIDKIRTRWPHLRDRIAWWRVNGAQPEICPKGGDEVNLTCPVITACFWYGTDRYAYKLVPHANGTPCYVNRYGSGQAQSSTEHEAGNPAVDPGPVTLGDNGMAYVMYPPYPRMDDYLQVDRHRLQRYFPPFSLCHSVRAWGYGPIIDDCTALGVRHYGNNSPAGQIDHRQVRDVVASSLALVHLKSVDCPGWALYEAMLCGCPVMTGRLFKSRTLMVDLLVDGETCLEFGVPASLDYGRGPVNDAQCLSDIETGLEMLKLPAMNRDIGESGRQRLLNLMWQTDRDGPVFKAFCESHFG